MATADHAARDSRARAAQFTCGYRLGRAGRSPPRGCAPWKLTLAGAGSDAPALQPSTRPGLPGVPGSPEVSVQPAPSQPLRGRGRAWRMTLAEKLPALRRRRGPGGGPAPLGAAASGTQHGRLGRVGRSRPPVCTAGVRAPALRSSRPRPPLRRSARASGCPAPGAGIPPPARAPPAHEAPPPPRSGPPRTCAGPSGCCRAEGWDPGICALRELAGHQPSSCARNRRWVPSAPPCSGVPPH